MGEIATALGLSKGIGARASASPQSAIARQIACGGRRARPRRSVRDRRLRDQPFPDPRSVGSSNSPDDGAADATVRGEEVVLERGARVAVRIRIELENLGISADALTEAKDEARSLDSQESLGDPTPAEALREDPSDDSPQALEEDAIEGAPHALREDPTGDAGEDSLRECVEAHVKLLSELAAPIVAAEGADHLRARLAEFTGFLSPRHPQLLGSLAFHRGGVVDPEDLVQRALRLPEDREREVQLALGELVSYLEFELLNHPGIEDGASILEGLEGLRSRL